MSTELHVQTAVPLEAKKSKQTGEVNLGATKSDGKTYCRFETKILKFSWLGRRKQK